MVWQAYIPAAVTAASSVLGAMNSGNNNEHVGSGELYADDMQDYFNQTWTGNQDLQDRTSYQGDWTAGMNPMMQQNIADQYKFSQGAGADAANTMMGAGNNMLGAGQQGMDYLNQMQQRGPNQFQYDQGTYDQSFNNLTGGMQNQFDLGAQQMQQNFDWNMLPGLNMAGALGGQQGATKQYQNGALGQGLTDQNIAQFGSDIWKNAANQSNQMGFNAGSQNLGSANNFDQNMVNNYGQYAQQGANMVGQGYDMNTNNLGIGQNAGGLQQGYNQSVADSSRAQWDQDQNQPWIDQKNRNDFLQSYAVGQPYQDGGMTGLEGAWQGAQTGAGIYGMGQDAGWWGNQGSTFDPISNPTQPDFMGRLDTSGIIPAGGLYNS
jgi:hypothetical protein